YLMINKSLSEAYSLELLDLLEASAIESNVGSTNESVSEICGTKEFELLM
ncbi:40416_t:CDS:1, partial [Gigaspora margarita]